MGESLAESIGSRLPDFRSDLSETQEYQGLDSPLASSSINECVLPKPHTPHTQGRTRDGSYDSTGSARQLSLIPNRFTRRLDHLRTSMIARSQRHSTNLFGFIVIVFPFIDMRADQAKSIAFESARVRDSTE